MGAGENKELLQRIYAELAQGNGKPFVDAMADDFRWTIMGHTKWSRSYEGKQSVLDDLIGPLRARLRSPMKTVGLRFIAEGDAVVVEARGENVTRSGVPYENRYCFIFKVKSGKLRELTEYLDTELVTAVLG